MPRLLVLLIALVLLTPTRAPAQDDVIVFEPTPTLTIYRSTHYRIHTNLTRTQTQPIGRHMDSLYEQYERRFRGLGKQQIEPMPLYLFATEQQYDRFLAEHDIDATHSGGMFFVTHQLQGLATWVDARSRRQTIEVLQHEGFHQFAWHVIGPKLPVWLNEGLAQYFESAVITDGRMTLGMTNAARIQNVKEAIDTDQTLSLAELTTITGEQWGHALRRDAPRSARLYAQSWSVAYFLIHGDAGIHQPKLTDYLKRLANGDTARDAELMAFGPRGLAALESSWKAFAKNHQSDEVAKATDRLEFLGTGLRLLAEQDRPMPDDLDQLRTMLQEFGFKLRRRELGITRNLSADDEALYRYERSADEQRDFILLKPERQGLPPRITAPGLEPEPTLIWRRDSDGKLVQDIAYR